MAKKQFNLTQKELQRVLHYDPSTGIFIWRANTSTRNLIGNQAGRISATKHGHRYVNISIHTRSYGAHRLAWLYVHGYWPPHLIDHIDRDGTNNRIDNLRLATRSQNTVNTLSGKNSWSGLRGVGKNVGSAINPYYAKINVSGKLLWLGVFSTAEAAHKAYLKAAIEHYGEFVPS